MSTTILIIFKLYMKKIGLRVISYYFCILIMFRCYLKIQTLHKVISIPMVKPDILTPITIDVSFWIGITVRI